MNLGNILSGILHRNDTEAVRILALQRSDLHTLDGWYDRQNIAALKAAGGDGLVRAYQKATVDRRQSADYSCRGICLQNGVDYKEPSLEELGTIIRNWSEENIGRSEEFMASEMVDVSTSIGAACHRFLADRYTSCSVSIDVRNCDPNHYYPVLRGLTQQSLNLVRIIAVGNSDTKLLEHVCLWSDYISLDGKATQEELLNYAKAVMSTMESIGPQMAEALCSKYQVTRNLPTPAEADAILLNKENTHQPRIMELPYPMLPPQAQEQVRTIVIAKEMTDYLAALQ